jgi:hypothetical protein
VQVLDDEHRRLVGRASTGEQRPSLRQLVLYLVGC